MSSFVLYSLHKDNADSSALSIIKISKKWLDASKCSQMSLFKKIDKVCILAASESIASNFEKFDLITDSQRPWSTG